MKNEVTKRIWHFTLDNLSDGHSADAVRSTIKKSLDSIDEKITNGTIVLDINNPTRIGILALTANPLHWGHIASCLVAVDELNLSTLFLLIHGEMTYKKIDESQKMSKQVRHYLVKKICEHLTPIIQYCDIGFDNDTVGEFNTSKLVKKYPDAEFFYYTGSETTTRVESIIKNLTTAQKDHSHKTVTLAVLPIGEFLDLDEYVKLSKHPVVVFGRDYNCELHSTQYRAGDKSIVPKFVHDMIEDKE